MKHYSLADGALSVSAVALGCMRLGGKSPAEADRIIKTAFEHGIQFFDHADIYGGGACEELFGQVLKANPSLRDGMILQSKCGIRNGRYDSSYEHIVASAEGSLARLGVDCLDVLLIHRPDALAEPEEMARAFEKLHRDGKVKHFGVSNHNPDQIELLRRECPFPILFNQLQFSPTNSTMIDRGINVNTAFDGAVDRDGGVLDYCRLHGITIQPWSPFQHGFFGGVFLGDERYAQLNRALEEVADAHGITPTGAVIAWILRHPAKMQPIVGTMNPDRIREIADAANVTISREEWYAIYRSASHTLP
ncbi:MAG: aldo/keto reductase [Clostridia bacterium]|nr:aldo/keto reductase [Clostridia bacterium]